MKLLRHGPTGQERPGILDAEGKIRDLSGKVDDIDGDDAVAREPDASWRALDAAHAAGGRGTRASGRRWRGIGKFIAIGLNYADHAAESGMPMPKEPVVFMKATSCIIGPNDDVCCRAAR